MLQTVEVFERDNGCIVLYGLLDAKPVWANIYDPSIPSLRYACTDLDLLLTKANLFNDSFWEGNLFEDRYFTEPGKRLGKSVKSVY